MTGELAGADGLALVTPDADLHERARARTRAVIDLAATLHTIVNIGRLRGRLAGLGDAETAWPIAVEQLRPVIAYAAERNVRIAIEPINRYETDFIHTAHDGLRMVRDLGLPNLGLMLDLFHMNIEEVDIAASLRATGEHLLHVHIADSNRRYPGSGHIPYAPIFAALRAMDYRGYVSAELLPWPDADTAAEKTLAFLHAQF